MGWGDGYNGLKVTLSDKMNEFVPQMGNYYQTCLAGETLLVANEMLSSSKNFIYELSTWINMKYTNTLA
jgi:hypothetical protein